jgi:RNA polymerase sigma-70 factor (ECF subfamily)
MGAAPPEPDAGLLGRWRAGDPAAFAEIVRGWERPVGRFLARLTGCPHRAGDLLQETFTRVYLARGRYRDDGHFSTWVYRIALNLARDAARRRPAPLPLADADPPAAPAGDPADRRETAALVAAALAALPDPLREAVVLRHYEGMSFEGMARLLGTPATTLKSRFAAALKALAADLVARGLRPEDLS